MKQYKATFYKTNFKAKEDEEPVRKNLGSVRFLFDPKSSKDSIYAIAFRRASLEQCSADSVYIEPVYV